MQNTQQNASERSKVREPFGYFGVHIRSVIHITSSSGAGGLLLTRVSLLSDECQGGCHGPNLCIWRRNTREVFAGLDALEPRVIELRVADISTFVEPRTP